MVWAGRRARIAGVSIAAAAAILVVGGEITVRVVLNDRVERAAQLLGLPDGIQISLAHRPVLPSLAAGRVPLDVTISSSNLDVLTRCLPAASDTELSIEGGEIVARRVVTVRGAEMPVTVTLSPVIDSGTLRLIADDVSVAGLTLPPAAVDGIRSSLPVGELLADGVELGTLLPRGVTLHDVELDDASLRLSLDVPVARAQDPSRVSSSPAGRAANCVAG